MTAISLPAGPFAVAFPGQGVDPVDLGRILAAHDDTPLVDRLAEHLAHRDWASLDINDTRVAQPSVYAASVLQARDHLATDAAAACFGHSMGELSALAFAGVFSAVDGLDLMVRRAELGHAAHEKRSGAMTVIMRLDRSQVEWVRRRVLAEISGVLEWAVVNGPAQFVLAGDEEAVDRANDLVVELDGVGRRLPIGGAYHSPLLLDAVEPYADAIARLELHDPVVPVVSCTTQRSITSSADVVEVLSRALALPVEWIATMHAVKALGVERAVDAGPGSTLANLARFSPVLEFTALSPPKTATHRA